MAKLIVILEQIVSWQASLTAPEGVDLSGVSIPSEPAEVRELERREVESGEPVTFDLSRYSDVRWIRTRYISTGGDSTVNVNVRRRTDG